MIYFYTTHNITYMQQRESYNSLLLGKRVKALREKQSSSLNAFVMSKGGLTTATWSRIENGKTDVKLSTIIKTAAILNTTVDKLLQNIDFDYSIEE